MFASELTKVVDAIQEVYSRTGVTLNVMSVSDGHQFHGVDAEITINDGEFARVGFDDVELSGTLQKGSSVGGSPVCKGVVFYALTAEASEALRSKLLAERVG